MDNVITFIRSMFCSSLRQERHRLKKAYFARRNPSSIPTTSPIPHMTDDQWRDLVDYWSAQKNLVWFVQIVQTRSHYLFVRTGITLPDPPVFPRQSQDQVDDTAKCISLQNMQKVIITKFGSQSENVL